ncbi:regulator [Halomonas sp. DQ26W]|uniref:ligand-binding sensor domain-containing protein n=1 Tax=Halomonas sp. DQ26W TaxID=2282311 RepID=UPI000DF7A84A|nr:two-component regulator propeller domain-containing protein [Halomonas sp. DQ26W]RDB42432.1 regulator [Halomonas sp. DQ26W]
MLQRVCGWRGLGGLALMLGAGVQAQAAPYTVVESFNVGDDVYVRSLAVEADAETLWVGTSSGLLEIGLAGYEVRNTFTRADGLANEYIFAIGIDSRGYKWFGTNAGGVSRYRDGEWQTFFPMHGLADYWVYVFDEQPNGDFWIGTWEGANRVDLDTLTFHTYLDELINEWVYGLAIDSEERVWFGTEGGVSMFDGETWEHWTHDDGLGSDNHRRLSVSPNTGLGTRDRHDLTVLEGGEETFNPNYIFAMHADPEDRIWAGTWGGGVSVYENGAWYNYTSADGLAGDLVYSILQAEDGAYWFGTNRGVSRFDGETWQTLDTGDGLLASHVYALAQTPDGDIWAASRRGVTRLGQAE